MGNSQMHSISAILGAIGVIWFFYGPWQRILVDLLRQRLFEIRDNVFDIAADGRISFDDPAYRFLRDFLNTIIRFADRVSVPRFLFLSSVVRGAPRFNPEEILREVQDEEVRNLLLKRFKNACGLVVYLMWLRSPFTIVFTVAIAMMSPLIILVALISDRVLKIKDWLVSGFKQELHREVAAEFRQGH